MELQGAIRFFSELEVDSEIEKVGNVFIDVDTEEKTYYKATYSKSKLQDVEKITMDEYLDFLNKIS